MKPVLVALVAAGLLIPAAPGSAATPVEKRIASLERKVNTQAKQIKALQTKANETQALAAVAFVGTVCLVAVTADTIQGTWAVMNQVAGRSVLPAAVSLDDKGACNALRIQRQPTQVPPAISVLSALLGFLTQ
jgi:hypothetical protein